MDSREQDIRPVQTWGAFYFVRRAMDIRTGSELWIVEAGKIIVKIVAVIGAFALDILTGLLFVCFIVIKAAVKGFFRIMTKAVETVFEKVLSVVAYLVSLVLTAVVLYAIVSHWTEFRVIVEKLLSYVR